MRFGIFFELSVPPPFDGASERAVYENALEQAVLADELGFDWVWAVEHHFLEGYSHCSAPEVFLAAVAARTSQIRVGHGAVVCVPEMNHPVRVAERAAALDILSGGRLDVGTARSSTWTELGGFAVDPDLTKQTWDEYIHVLPRMWSGEPFSWEGIGWRMPERRVLPTPVQHPHPPLWVTVTTPGTELDAADRGIGCLGVAAVSFGEQERRTAEYRRRLELCEPVGAVNNQVTTQNFLFCHEDLDHAAAVGGSMAATFGLSNSHLLWTREAYPTSAYQSLGNLAPPASKADTSAPGERRPLPEGIAIGDPSRLVEEIRRWESVGIDGINFMLNALEEIPQAEVLASLRLFASDVMPKFRP